MKETLRIKRRYLFLFCISNLTVLGQSGYAVLVKHTMDPFKGWNGSHSGIHYIDIGSKWTSVSNDKDYVVIEYDFLYVQDNPTEIVCLGSTTGNEINPDGSSNDCSRSETIPYNKTTFNESSFIGCIGYSEILGIRLIQPIDDKICVEKTINLELGWDWQYSYDGSNWINFPSQYQAQRTISFKINELANYTGKAKIYFRTGYGTQFLNMISYTIIPCSPILLNSPIVTNTSCNYNNDGTVTFTFDRDLETGEYFNLNLNSISNGILGPLETKTVYRSDFQNKQYTWSGLKARTYRLVYQTWQDGGTTPTSISDPPVEFMITAPSPVTFSTTYADVSCNGIANGSINISASGGTPPYSYFLDNAAAIPFTSPLTITNLSAAIHTIKVTDTNGCYEK